MLLLGARTVIVFDFIQFMIELRHFNIRKTTRNNLGLVRKNF